MAKPYEVDGQRILIEIEQAKAMALRDGLATQLQAGTNGEGHLLYFFYIISIAKIKLEIRQLCYFHANGASLHIALRVCDPPT